jgi:hypothetical protein
MLLFLGIYVYLWIGLSSIYPSKTCLPAGRLKKCVMKTSFRNGGVFVDENQCLR